MPSLLLVDDDAAGLDLRALILRRHGYECVLAEDVDQARKLLLETKLDGVIMDLRLPDARDGMRLIREIHAADPLTLIIVVAGFVDDLLGQPEEALVYRALGKPVRAEILVTAIAAGLQNQALARLSKS